MVARVWWKLRNDESLQFYWSWKKSIVDPRICFLLIRPAASIFNSGKAMLTFLKSLINLFDHFFVFLHKLLIKQIHTSKLNNSWLYIKEKQKVLSQAQTPESFLGSKDKCIGYFHLWPGSQHPSAQQNSFRSLTQETLSFLDEFWMARFWNVSNLSFKSSQSKFFGQVS